MLNVKELKAEIVRNGYTQKEVAKMIGVSEKTFISRLKRGVFGTDEAKILIEKLNIVDVGRVFFADSVT